MTESLLEQGGVVLQVIFALSAIAWCMIIWKWLQLRQETRTGMGWADEAIERLSRGRAAAVAHVRALCGSQPNLLGRLMLASLAYAAPERRDFENHIKPVFEAEADQLRDHLGLISAIAACCPLLGLLGTVIGMVRTFEALGGGSVQTEQLAAGIGQALITTQAGLVVGLPLVLAHGYLASRIQHYVDQAALRVKKVETMLCVD